MALLAGELGAEERANDFVGDCRPDNPRSEAEDVHRIVLDALVGGIHVVTNGGANPVDLVRRDGGTDAAAATQDAAIGSTGENRRGDPLGVVRVIDRLGRKRPEIDSLVAAGLDALNNGWLQGESGVVAANCDAHRVSSLCLRTVCSVFDHLHSSRRLLHSATGSPKCDGNPSSVHLEPTLGYNPRMTDNQHDPGAHESPSRDFTVATFVVHGGRVLLLWHRKLQMWLPPGGHIERNELPDEAAVREVLEEAGVEVELVGERGLGIERPRQLVRPVGIQLEDISPGHQHIDLIYFARPVGTATVNVVGNAESEAIGWFDREQMRWRGVNDEVRTWAERALQTLG